MERSLWTAELLIYLEVKDAKQALAHSLHCKEISVAETGEE